MRLLLLPAGVLAGIFFGAFLVFGGVGFLHSAPGTPGYEGPWTLANYLRLATDRGALEAFGTTIVFACSITVASVLLGYPTAYVIARSESKLARHLLLGALVLSFLTGSISRAYGWLIVLGRRGLVNDILLAAGIIDRPIALVYNNAGVFIALLHFTLPFFVLTVFGSIRSLSRRTEEAARDLGATAFQAFTKVTLPLTLPAIVSGATLVFALGMSAFAYPLLLGGGRVRLASNYIYDQIFVSFDLPYAAAAATAFLTVAIGSLFALFMLERAAGRVVRREP
ncbi:ABC transporter permease [Bradyrhizobium prioriisuperbiae]|uniref:ABC transporter permease n=1 Tax=Bradyrhizobium prioriisuperbiae TaxID=2854389 RepID=UPI0028E65FB7|nr:ABC transporter permease [Bradyrhizobium prioritasuperba]